MISKKINKYLGGFESFIERCLKELDDIWEDAQGYANFIESVTPTGSNVFDCLKTNEYKIIMRDLWLYPRVQYTKRFGNDEYLMAQEHFRKTVEWKPTADISKWINQ